MGHVLGTVGQRFRIQPRSVPSVDLDDHAAYPHSCTITLGIALSPHAGLHLDDTAPKWDTETTP